MKGTAKTRIFKNTKEKNVLVEPWPTHIPGHCPQCETQMTRKVNISVARSKFAQLLREIAPWLSIVVLFSSLVLLYLTSFKDLAGLGQGSPMALVAVVVGIPMIVTIFSNCLRKVFKLHCHQCGHSSDYPLI